MTIKPNYERGRPYLWVGRSTLAFYYLGGKGLAHSFKVKSIPLYIDKPKEAGQYHRCYVVIVRTKREAQRCNGAVKRIIANRKGAK